MPAVWLHGLDNILSDRCGRCHNGMTAKGFLDITSYDTVLTGGNSGPGVVPGNPDASELIRKQMRGGHYEQLTDAELEALRAWIAAGAPNE